MRRTVSTSNTIEVKVQLVGQAAETYSLPVDSTVEDLLEIAGIPTSSRTTIGGELAELEFLLDDGDVLVVENKKIVFG